MGGVLSAEERYQRFQRAHDPRSKTIFLGHCMGAWHFQSRQGRANFEPLIIEGIFFEKHLSSFQVEAIGLEHASMELRKWCSREWYLSK